MTKMTTPKKFAERYMQREAYLPFISNMSGLLYLPDVPTMSELEMIYKTSYKNKVSALKKTTLDSLENYAIDTDTKKKIYSALHELTKAIILDIIILKKLNKDLVKKRKDTIKYLEKVLEYPLIEKRQIIIEEIERLKAFNKNKKAYKDVDCISSWYHIFYAGLFKKLVLKIETKKILKMLSIPISFKKGRSQKFFSKALQIIVFKYLHEHAKFPLEKAKHHTVRVINEYIEKKGYTNITTLSHKDIDDALREL